MKIAVLISGGVDSSVALQLLKNEGHDLTAFYLKIWLEDELKYLGECPWKEDLAYVRQICEQANVPLEIVNMQKEYWDNVVSYTISEAKAGRTPNPDIFCNQLVKFGAFYDKIDQSFEKVATGHYAQVVKSTGHRTQDTAESLVLSPESFLLKRAPDLVKDQTYFLAHLNQKQLSRAMFPIGKYTKSEVRELAEKYNLPNKDRKDSQGICFLGKVPFKEFIEHHLGKKPGDFVDIASGKVIGQHDGYWFYTIGQRQGLGLSGGPWFVVKKDVEKNIVYLANGYEPEEVYCDSFEVGEIHWINDDLRLTTRLPDGQVNDLRLDVKIRHGAVMHPCRLEVKGNGGLVELSEKVHGVAPGQYAVFYQDDVCLGCGMIL